MGIPGFFNSISKNYNIGINSSKKILNPNIYIDFNSLIYTSKYIVQDLLFNYIKSILKIDYKTDLDNIKLHIEKWKSFGKVPVSRRHVEGKFNKILDALFDKLSTSKKESEMVRFANRLDTIANSDAKKMANEKIFIIILIHHNNVNNIICTS